MKLIAEVIKPVNSVGSVRVKAFHVRLAKGRRRFLMEDVVTRHIGPRPWSEATWVDRDGHVHEVFVTEA
jgi:hypothetical protein